MLSNISLALTLLLLGAHPQASLLILSKLMNFYSPLKSSENLRFSDDFRRNISSLIHLNSLNIRNKIWKQSLTKEYPYDAQKIKIKSMNVFIKSYEK